MQRFGGAVNQGAVRLLLALGRRAGGHVQPGEVSQQEEGRTRKKVRKQGGRDGDPGCAGIGAPTAAAAGHYVAAALTRAPPSGIVVLHGGPAYGERRRLWMPTSPTSHSPTAQSAGKEIPC